MICDEAGEYVSALCDGEIIPPAAAEHIGTCETCQARLRIYAAMGQELRRVASLESAVVSGRTWTRPQNKLAKLWQKGWGTMRIPRFAFALLIGGILALASAFAVEKVRAHDTGTVVLLNTAGLNGPIWDCALSMQDKNSACSWFGGIGSHHLAYKVEVLSRTGNRLLLAIRTRTFVPGEDLSSFTRDADPAAQVSKVWFEPGERLKVDVPEVGTLTLTGEWMDHIPIFLGQQRQDFSPGPGEIRIASALLVKDKTVVGDLAGLSSSINETENPDEALGIYMPGQGRFLLSQLPMKGAVKADVNLGRVSFNEGGHSWEFVASAPVSREDHIWVLHQRDFKMKSQATFADAKLVQTEPGVWVLEEMQR